MPADQASLDRPGAAADMPTAAAAEQIRAPAVPAIHVNVIRADFRALREIFLVTLRSPGAAIAGEERQPAPSGRLHQEGRLAITALS